MTFRTECSLVDGKRWVVFLLLMLARPCFSEDLTLSISQTLIDHDPRVVAQITRVLAGTDYDVKVLVSPNKRSLSLLTKGEVAIDALRADVVIDALPNVIAINPPVVSYIFKMVTSSEKAELCDIPESEFHTLSVVGILGFEVHRIYFFPKFGKHFEVPNAVSALTFLSLGRADVVFSPEDVLSQFDESLMKQLHVCDTYAKRLNFHSVLSDKYLWALPSLEAAYKKVFGEKP